MTQHLPQRSKADSIACRENRCLLPPGLRTQRYRRAVTPPRFTEIRWSGIGRPCVNPSAR